MNKKFLFLSNNEKDINLDLLKLIASRLEDINDVFQFIQLNSAIFKSIDSFFWQQRINIWGKNFDFYEYLIDYRYFSYDFLVYMDEMIQIDFDDEFYFQLEYRRYDDRYDEYFLSRWYKFAEGQKIVKYFLTHLKRQLTSIEAEFILEIADVVLFEAVKNSLFDPSIIPNDDLVLMLIYHLHPDRGYGEYQKNIDKVIECLDWLFKNKYNIILDAEDLEIENVGYVNLDLKILKWFKAHNITILNIDNNKFINGTKDVIIWVVNNLNRITSYSGIAYTFSLTFKELDELIQKKILPIPTLDEIDNIDDINEIAIAKIFKRIKDKYYPNK